MKNSDALKAGATIVGDFYYWKLVDEEVTGYSHEDHLPLKAMYNLDHIIDDLDDPLIIKHYKYTPDWTELVLKSIYEVLED